MPELEVEQSAAREAFGGQVEISPVRVETFDEKKPLFELRAKIAKYLLIAFLTGIGIIIVGGPMYNLAVTQDLRIDTLNFLTTYAGILGPFVGVISGYYFKN